MAEETVVTTIWPPDTWFREIFARQPIRTKRLLLRPLAARDADDVWRYQSDAEILRYIPWPERTREEARAHTELRAGTDNTAGEGALRNDGDRVFLAVELAAGTERGRVIGDLMLRVASTVKHEIEVGWVFARDQHGRGYAAESAAEVLRLAFESLEAQRVIAQLDDRNTASATLCTRLGMRHEGTAFEKEWEPSGWVNLALYGIDREEWAAQISGSPVPRSPSPVPVPPALPSEGPPAPLPLPYNFIEQSAIPLRTERLKIRRYSDGDTRALQSLLGDPEVTRYLRVSPMSMPEAASVIEQDRRGMTLAKDGDAVKLALEYEGRCMGRVKLQVSSAEARELEIGWILSPTYQGKGLASEAATALLNLAIEKIGAHRVIAYLDPNNFPSAALATRLGLRLEQHSHADWPQDDDSWSDTAVYALTAAEWRDSRLRR
ncbi:GNAT family N-acetyltransferase [Leucobacter insecticola]|uniref:GNAT family N-acetyltransferase n=1 Tax=Leucobacter insecticola TaxID=2714934 RepID=A0A6G8FKY8_9MICO|nr:GNAT family N-acetyltransferase [Leucobacter insecticola]QIM17021.1 GNAT family N-acetyltransferase [Leucobacter insecticola]